MKYLHNSDIKVHGRLKSTNCVVDGRFTCKITDYGLPLLYNAQKIDDEKFGNEKAEDLLWTAPELLKNDNLRRTGTQVRISVVISRPKRIILAVSMTTMDHYIAYRIYHTVIIYKLCNLSVGISRQKNDDSDTENEKFDRIWKIVWNLNFYKLSN